MSEPIRHPRNPSWWKRSAEPAAYVPLAGRTSADVIVVGGGIVGLTTGLLLKEAGMRVTLLEANRVGEGTTGYSSAKLTSLHRLSYASIEDRSGREAARVYAEANEWALARIAGFAEELGIDCQFQRRAALTFTRDADRTHEIDAEVEAGRRAGLAVEKVVDSDLPFPIAAGIRLDRQASFHPLRYCLGLAKALDGAGCHVHEGSQVEEVEGEDERVLVRTRDGAECEAPHVVLACGIPFLDRGGFFARVHPSRSYCVAMSGADVPPESMSINIGEPTLSIRPIPRAEGEPLLLVTGADHKTGQAEDHEEPWELLETFAQQEFGAREVVARWSSQDYMSVDGLPLIGRMRPSSQSIHVATGFGKWGLTLGTAAARILADGLTGATNPWAETFDAGRSQLSGGLGEAIGEGMNDAKRFVGDRIRQLSGPEPEELAPGAGAICRHEGDAVAAYRDEEGRLHLLSPTCTHLGCRVVWNSAETSWDCPCHGSRFSVSGEVLNGPAVTPLESL
ncbi:MAG: FAD-dependent oxidoreductase [Gemmatimonadales bacterium]|nr:MAG: FAD-dependent oxidoreductase [Gemmatimonadales bacterium]